MTFENAIMRAAGWANRNRRLLKVWPILGLLHARRGIQRAAEHNRALRVFLATLAAVTRNDAQQMIAGVAYYGVIALIPISVGVLQLLELILGTALTAHWYTRLSSAVFPSGIELTTLVGSRNSAAASITAGLALVGLTWGSFKLFGAVGLVVNRMWGIEPTQVGYIARAREFFILIATALILLISSVTTYLVDQESLPNLLRDFQLVQWANAMQNQRWVSDIATTVVSAAAFMLVYRYVPERTVRWKWAMIASVFAGIAFKLSNDGFALILGYVLPAQLLYGPLATVLVFLMWMFASSMILAAGAAACAYAQSIYEGDGPKTGPGWFLR